MLHWLQTSNQGAATCTGTWWRLAFYLLYVSFEQECHALFNEKIVKIFMIYLGYVYYVPL
jgi:hypothetical protein